MTLVRGGRRTGSGIASPGESAYQVALDNGFVGTQAQWLASLVGPKGDKGDAGTGVSGLPTPSQTGQRLASKSNGTYILVNEGPLQFTDPRVGGVLDDGTTDNGAVTPGFADGLSAVERATAMLRTGGVNGPGGELHFGNPGRPAVCKTSKPLVVPNACVVSGETFDDANSLGPAFDGSTPPFKYGTAIIASSTFTGGGVVIVGDNNDSSAGANKRHSGNVGAVMRNITVDGAIIANTAVLVTGARALLDSVASHRAKSTGSALKVDGQGAIIENGWAGNANSGNGILVTGFDCHLFGYRISQCAISVKVTGAGLYMSKGNHLFTSIDTGDPLVSGSRNIVLQGAANYTITGNVIENTALEEILIQPAGDMTGCQITSNLFYNGSSAYAADSTAIWKLDSSAAGSSMENVQIRANVIRFVTRPLALLNIVPGSVFEGVSCAQNDALLAGSFLAPGSLMPDGDVSGNVLRTTPGSLRKTTNRGTVSITYAGTTPRITHKLATYTAQVPRYADVKPANDAAATAGVRYVAPDDTGIGVVLQTPPANGTVLNYFWEAEL